MAVVPAKNEQGRIGKVLNLLSETAVDRIVVVLNGSRDGTLKEIRTQKLSKVDVLRFREPLGYDIPRAVGVFYALKQGAECVIFVDGDMTGNLLPAVNRLVDAVVSEKVDLAMTECQSDMISDNKLARELYLFRKLFNEHLGIYQRVGVAIPSHGPCAVSRRLMISADIRDFAVPPVILAFAVKHHLCVEAPVAMHSRELGSKMRGFSHAKKIAETIIGDIIEALAFFEGKPRKRIFLQKEYQGYNPRRRFDLLERFIALYGRNPDRSPST
ncbi:glycosyltransferase [Thermosediminibacter litoriperuensis]|nr:glycosyltransferase [Thermosediminibacter litoriperuensis]